MQWLIVAWPSLSIEVTGGHREIQAAPGRQLGKLAWRRKSDVARDMQLDAGRERQAAPQRARQPRFDGGFDDAASLRAWLDLAPDLIEGAPRFLQRLHAQQLVEMRPAVVVATPDTERRRQEVLLYVVTDRPAGDAAEIGKIPNRIARFVRHEAFI